MPTRLRLLVAALLATVGLGVVAPTTDAAGTNAPFQVCTSIWTGRVGQTGSWISSGVSRTPTCHGVVTFRSVLGSGDDWARIDAAHYTVIVV